MADSVDVLVVGGGINGAGIARDAAGRGLTVCLCEQDDLASHTSSASTKLIHGGLRYLEQYEFALVGKALAEREVLLRLAPHIIWPLRFVLPHQPHLRPGWMIRMGLFLYDHLGRGRRSLPPSRRIRLRRHALGAPLQKELRIGFVYSDAWVQDARLVVLNAMDAARLGAQVLTRTRCERVVRAGERWHARLRDGNGEVREFSARAVVNATGPWAVRFLDDVMVLPHSHTLRLVKGSHIVVPKLFGHRHAYIFQQPDRRIVFAIPYEHDFTLIGTTDEEFSGDAAHVDASAAEIDYLCAAANRYFRQQLTPDDVVWNYSGVRPLLEDERSSASEVTRDYLLDMESEHPPLLNVFGGKITTYRRLAEEAVDRLAIALGVTAPAWTADGAPLPGGDCADIARSTATLTSERPWLDADFAWRLTHSYGTLTTCVLGAATSIDDLGEHFGAGLYRAEVDYLHRHEWARTAEDILWRRGKLGLRLDATKVARLEAYLQRG